MDKGRIMSPATPKPYHPEIDDPQTAFNVEQHQIDVFRAGGRRDDLWEFLERAEAEQQSEKHQP
jgi:hypothetical protein